MANVYVRSGAGGAGTGADWANAYTTLAAALTAKAAGDDFWVSEDHAESTAGVVTLTSPGTLANPCRVLCVNHAGSVPPVAADLATTATVSTTGANNIIFTGSGATYCYGITFQAGDAANSAGIRWNGGWWSHKNCGFSLRGTALAQIATCNLTGVKTTWDNCTAAFNSTSHSFRPGSGIFEWKNTASAVSGATLPSVLFDSSGSGIIRIHGVDLSALGAGKTLVASGNSNNLNIRFEDCKLNASVTKYGAPSAPEALADFIRCDSSGTNYKFERSHYYGTEVQETTIVRTGGASDGAQAVAKKIVTTANAKFHTPFEALPIVAWNDGTSAVTVTVYGVWGGGAVPNNDDIWIEVEYLGDASSGQASFISTAKASVLASNAATTSDSSTWGGSTTKFKMVTSSFTPAQKGPFIIRIFAAAASSTFYIDPKVAIA